MKGQDEAPEIDRLFVGLTRPPMLWGVPMIWFGITFLISALAFILSPQLFHKFLLFLLVTIPLHVFGYVMSERDPHWMNVLLVAVRYSLPNRNYRFWKSNSYSP